MADLPFDEAERGLAGSAGAWWFACGVVPACLLDIAAKYSIWSSRPDLYADSLFGVVHFHFHQNTGLMLGVGNSVDERYRAVVLAAISGLVLVGIYLVTQPIILKNQAEFLTKAIFRVLPGTTSINTFLLSGEQLEPYESADDSMPTENAIFAGHAADGTLIGYAVPADGAGFMDTIKLIYGFDPRRRAIVGMQVLDSRETPGLGDKIIFDEEFHQNFVELKVEPAIVGVKVAENPRPSNEVDTITGATISSEAVISILNRSTERWLPLLDKLTASSEGAEGEVASDDTPEGS